MTTDYQSLPWHEKLRIAEAAKPGDVWIDNEDGETFVIEGRPIKFASEQFPKATGLQYKVDMFAKHYHPAPPAEEDKEPNTLKVIFTVRGLSPQVLNLPDQFLINCVKRNEMGGYEVEAKIERVRE